MWIHYSQSKLCELGVFGLLTIQLDLCSPENRFEKPESAFAALLSQMYVLSPIQQRRLLSRCLLQAR